jgi:hypothetical protein
MIKVRNLVFASLIFLFSCVAPKQPSLNDLEESFILKVEDEFNCKVKREISVNLLKPNRDLDEKGSYGLHMQLSCSMLLKMGKDPIEIQKKSFTLANNIYNDIIIKNDKYNKIWISFSCDTSNSNYKDLVFTYKIDTETDSLIKW